MNEIIVKSQAGSVSFPNYQEIYNQAIELAEHIAHVEVTEDNIKTTKKMLASVNKRVNELEDSRKAVKKELLKPYEVFENQVKQIVAVVKEADTMVRQQVKYMEEQERQEKREAIIKLWVRRMDLYPELMDVFTYLDFITPQHLNKTTSLNKVEEEMVAFMEQTKQAVMLIADLEDSEEVLVEYMRCKNPVQAIQIVKDRKQAQSALAPKRPIDKSKTVTIEFDEQFLSQVHVFLKMSSIPYIKK
jgi:ribosomal protein L20